MPRRRIPHGNRPRVPAGFGTSRNQTSGHNGGALSHSPHLSTHPTTIPPPRHCPAASPSFSQHFSSNHVSEEDTRRRGSKHKSKAMTPPVASFYAPTGSGKPPASHSLLGQSYKPPSNEKFAKLPAVTMVRASPGMGNQGEVKNGLKTQSETAAHPSSVTKPIQDNHAGKSLLGQSYQAPSKERLATVPAVKMVLSESQKHNADLHGRPEPSGVKLKDKEKENSPIVSPKTGDHAHPAGGAEQKAVVSNGEEGLARFSDDSGRRVCLANVPPGTSKTDVRDMLVSQASAKVSLEDITVYSFQGSRPSYALVESESEQEAGRIAIWIDRECLFGWPISARVVRTMTKDQVSIMLRGEAVDDSGIVESLTEDHAPSWATTTPQLTAIPCRYWEQGYCRDGPSCIFSHHGPSGMPARFNRHQHTDGLQASLNLECYPDEEDLLGTRIYRGRFRDNR